MSEIQENLIDKALLEAYHDELMKKVVTPLMSLGTPVEGFMRVAGTSDPALSYRHIEGYGQGKSWTNVFYPCLVGTKLSGNDAQVGKILYVLDKLGATVVDGAAKWRDTDGNLHAIDGSEGDIQVVNIKPIYEISGRYTISNVEYDIMLRGLSPFVFNGIEASVIERGGMAPDYTVAHNDSGTTRMHSVYNPAWNGSFQAQNSIDGVYDVTTDAQTGEVVETFNSAGTLLGGAGGCHSTNIALYDGEQYAMNQNTDTTKTYPWMNATARMAELLWSNMVAEGGTFDMHKAALFGSGFCSNDGATAAADWEESATGAKNGVRVYDKNNTPKYFALNANIKSWTGKSSDFYIAQMINDWRNPFKCMEAYRVLCYAIEQGIPELQWFAFEGHKYKWRGVNGYVGPLKGEATAVVFKMLSGQAASNVLDPTDKATSIEGHRIDFMVSVGLYHGVTTQVSPSWWTSGLVMTEDENGQYKCYMQRDQTKLLKTPNGDKATTDSWPFESQYTLVGTFAKGEGYRKNYSNQAFMVPDSDANKSGATLHTYVCGYNWFTGGNAPAGKKSVRGFRRGSGAGNTNLSALTLTGNAAPSAAGTNFAFGTCCRVVDDD